MFMNINYLSQRPAISEAFAFAFFRYSILANGTLIIRRVDDSDVGVYKCVGIGRTGPLQSYAAELLLACKSTVFRFDKCIIVCCIKPGFHYPS